MDSKRQANYKNGFWMWDEVTNGLLFVSRDMSTRLPSQSQVISSESMKGSKQKKNTKEIVFRETVDHLDQARFRRYHQRRCKPNEPEVITIQDIKDITIFLANPKRLSLDFIKFFHLPTMDRFLRSLIVYFQCYMQVWEILLERREEAKRKLYQPLVTDTENKIRDDLSDLRAMVSREYSAILVGAKETRRYHHMLSNKNNVSLSDKDRKMFEMLISMAVRVVWVALYRKNLKMIEMELNRMLRTDLFNPILHGPMEMAVDDCPTSNEARILRGEVDTVEKKLLHRSLIAKEMVLGKHDHRLLVIGIKQFEPTDQRMRYLEIAFSAPEEQLLSNNVRVGLLGLPRKDYDAMLMQMSHTAKKRKTARVYPKFKLPLAVQHGDETMPKAFPKERCKYKESQQTIRSRAEQLEMWRNAIEKFRGSRELSILDLSATVSQMLLSSRSSISMTAKQSPIQN